MNAIASRPTVLVLDDEPSVRETGRRFLSARGYQCVEAESFEDALQALRTRPVDAAILDVRLPGHHSGLDLLSRLRQDAELSEIPVLIMTGNVLTNSEQADIARQRGVLFYKPEGFGTIVKYLDETIRH
jgi:CheY-like chemotaxis protein